MESKVTVETLALPPLVAPRSSVLFTRADPPVLNVNPPAYFCGPKNW